MEPTSSKKAQTLLSQLQDIIDDQEKTISQQQIQITHLKLEVDQLTKDRDALLDKIKNLENSTPVSSSSKKRHKKKGSTSSHQKATSDHQVENKPVDAGLSKRLDFTATLERSSSLQRKHLEEQDMRHRQAEGYELSADLRDKQLEVLRKQYGGAEKCEQAARVIQEAYRKYQMKVSFDKIRRSKSRRLTLDRVILPSPQKSKSPKQSNFSATSNGFVESKLEHSIKPNQETSFTISLETDELENQTSEKAFEVSDTLTTENGTIPNAEKVGFTGAPSANELGKPILNDSPSARKFPRKKRHPYETVVVGGKLPATPEHESTSSIGNNELLPQSINSKLLQPRLSDGDINARRPSPSWQRTNSEISLTSFDNEADGESLRSSDTGSINSEMLSNSGDGSAGYTRKNSVRSSWNVEILSDTEQRRLYRIGLNLFNMKPGKGLNFLIENGFVGSTAPSVARFLYNRNGLSRQMVGEYLGNTQKVFNQEVLDSICDLMDFHDKKIDEALRLFQSEIRVQGEAQKVERLVEAFSQRYCACNPSVIEKLQTPDSIFVLAFAIIMLNTDLHSPNMKHLKRMTEGDFIKNLRGVDNGQDLDETQLKNVYNRIKTKELVTKNDHVSHVLKVENSIIGKKPVLSVPHRRLISRCRLYQVTDLAKAQKLGVHKREVFLFNDMILITKILQSRKQATTYTFKQSITLYGLGCYLFDTVYYPYGIRLHNTLDNRVIITFNAPNESDRLKFVNDVKESIAEVQLMESMRIGAELEKAQLSSPTDTRSLKLSLSSKKFSTSMQNLNETRLVAANNKPSKRPASVFGLNFNDNNNSLNSSQQSLTSDGGSAPRNGPRIPVLGNLFATNRRNVPKRPPRTSASDSIPYLSPNGDSPGVTLTFHKVHEV